MPIRRTIAVAVAVPLLPLGLAARSNGTKSKQAKTQDPAFLAAVGEISAWQSAHCALGSR